MPAIILFASSTKTGLQKPNFSMLFAICLVCFRDFCFNPSSRSANRFEHNGTIASCPRFFVRDGIEYREACVNGIIYLIGLIVVIMAILSFLGLR